MGTSPATCGGWSPVALSNTSQYRPTSFGAATVPAVEPDVVSTGVVFLERFQRKILAAATTATTSNSAITPIIKPARLFFFSCRAGAGAGIGVGLGAGVGTAGATFGIAVALEPMPADSATVM